MSVTLVLGGARSGKSAHAERLAEASPKEVVYLATSRAGDAEMSARIRHHRDRRPAHWQTVEEELALAATLRAQCAPGRIVLVDCLTLWLSNLMLAGRDTAQARQALTAALGAARSPVVLVTNEVGWGIVPDNPLARRFRDEAGLLGQRVAAIADEVCLVACGLPLTLKG